MKRKGAVGPEDIPQTFLKSLGPLALQELLSIFNTSLHLADCPWIWRVAITIPLLKARKSPSDVASFRSINLTSCVVKLLEGIIANRLNYIAEPRNFFSRFQVGFRKDRSCENQILQIVQAIQDGFQQQPMEHSFMTLMHFSKAYDTVWWDKLFLCMLDAGIPRTFIRWLCFFLTDHWACVKLHNVCCSSLPFNQGLPQGSVLASLLFLFYINNLVENLSNNAVIAFFADDVSILTIARKKEDSVAAVQSEVNKVYDWSRIWKLNLNA